MGKEGWLLGCYEHMMMDNEGGPEKKERGFSLFEYMIMILYWDLNNNDLYFCSLLDF